ncbi:unnamed protein product, partial [Cyprideis torosa]
VENLPSDFDPPDEDSFSLGLQTNPDVLGPDPSEMEEIIDPSCHCLLRPPRKLPPEQMELEDRFGIRISNLSHVTLLQPSESVKFWVRYNPRSEGHPAAWPRQAKGALGPGRGRTLSWDSYTVHATYLGRRTPRTPHTRSR